MNSDMLGYALLFSWLGFSWGQWWAERRQKRVSDVGIKMLGDMLCDIIERRKIVGRAMTISSTHKFECLGEKLSIVVQAEGDPSALLEGEVVK